MTGQELVNRTLDVIQQGTSGRFTPAQILGFVNEGYVDFCRNTEMLEKSTTTSLGALESLVSIPSDFLDARQYRVSYNQELYPRTERDLDYLQNTGWIFEVGTPEQVVYYNYNVLRTKPISSAAATVTHRYAYIPEDITLTTEPQTPPVYHTCLADFASTQCFMIMREFKNGAFYYLKYKNQREKAKAQSRVGQQTPDTLTSQRPVTVFNYNRWDWGYRVR